jgi:cytochrome c553
MHTAFLALSSRWSGKAILPWLACLLALGLTPCVMAHEPLASTLNSSPASVQVCAGCHGVDGAGSAAGGPRIAGMNEQYLAHALTQFKVGQRASDVMQPLARSLSESDIDALADYFSTRQPPLAPASERPSPDLVAAGKALTVHGADNDVPACFTCHAEGGRGSGKRFPSIAGEPYAFVVNRLHEFQARARAGTAKPGSMTAVSSRLTEAQIQDAAAYLSVISPVVRKTARR